MKINRILAAFAAVASIWACQEKEDPTPQVTPEISVSPTSVSFEGDGGSLRVAVTTNLDAYTVTGNPEWLTVEQNGKELVLTAAQNTVNAERNCTLKLTADTASCDLAVSQKAGSPYPGFTVCKSAKLEYGGTVLYQFMKPTEEDYGGWGSLSLVDEDGNSLHLWIYTELFQSEEEVNLTPGTYVKGDDDYLGLKLSAKKITFMPGVATGDEEEAYIAGSYYTSVAAGTDIPLADGTILVGEDGGKTLVKVDMTDESGKAYKYVYIGDVEIDTTGATYPSATEHIDVAATVYGAVCYYKGDVIGNGTAMMALQLFSGDPENPAVTNYDFYMPAVEFAEDLDISGSYSTPYEGEEGEEGLEQYAAGSIDFGVMVDYGFFQYPSGAFVTYSFGDYLIADAYASLILTRQEDGKYTVSGALMSTAGETVFFFGADYTGIHDLEIPIVDVRESGGED